MMVKTQKYCTHCAKVLLDRNGKPMFELFDVDLYKKSNILKLVACVDCGAGIADRYCEFDGTLLLIDLVLQSREAYRHVLFNGGYVALIFKMALLTVICDGYICWSEIAGAGEFFEQEYQFYIMCSKVTLALTGFLLTVLISSFLVSLLFPTNTNLDKRKGAAYSQSFFSPSLIPSLKTLCLGLLMAYSSRFFNLMALLWSSSGPWHSNEVNNANESDPSSVHINQTKEHQTTSVLLIDLTTKIMWAFIYLLFFVSSIRVHQVTQGAPALTSLIQLTIGHAVFMGLLNIDFLINLNQCA